MVPDLEALGPLHYGNVYEDDTLEGMARRVLAIAPERFVLVGFSMGGFVARVLTLMAPERVTGVAFVASSARGYSDEETARRKAGYRPGDRPPRTSGAPRIAVSRSRPPAFVQALAEEMGAELVPMGSAGVKMMSVVRDVADAYVHAGGQYEWDSAAPVAVARAAGLFTSRVNGDELVYNQDDVYLPDLIVCRPELSERILAFIAEHGTD